MKPVCFFVTNFPTHNSQNCPFLVLVIVSEHNFNIKRIYFNCCRFGYQSVLKGVWSAVPCIGLHPQKNTSFRTITELPLAPWDSGSFASCSISNRDILVMHCYQRQKDSYHNASQHTQTKITAGFRQHQMGQWSFRVPLCKNTTITWQTPYTIFILAVDTWSFLHKIQHHLVTTVHCCKVQWGSLQKRMQNRCTIL